MRRLTLLRTTPSVARFSAIVATAPWPSFTFEINPLKVGTEDMAAVDALLIID